MADLRLDIAETFYSIQGESALAGYPCFFIRVMGCNLRCGYCDARYTYDEAGTSWAIEDLVDQAMQYPHALVEITGGEPLLQENVYPLMERLLANNRIVLLETNGSLSLTRVPGRVIKIMDIKCPDSGMAAHMDLTNLERLSPTDEVKFVLCSERDYDWARQMVIDHGITTRCRVSFSPVTMTMDPAWLAGRMLTDQLDVRLQLQLHTILWPGQQRGV